MWVIEAEGVARPPFMTVVDDGCWGLRLFDEDWGKEFVFGAFDRVFLDIS